MEGTIPRYNRNGRDSGTAQDASWLGFRVDQNSKHSSILITVNYDVPRWNIDMMRCPHYRYKIKVLHIKCYQEHFLFYFLPKFEPHSTHSVLHKNIYFFPYSMALVPGWSLKMTNYESPCTTLRKALTNCFSPNSFLSVAIVRWMTKMYDSIRYQLKNPFSRAKNFSPNFNFFSKKKKLRKILFIYIT
jgi:hypothetical protein